MHKIRVTKEFEFEMAHALWNYDGKCRNIHGHSYKMAVTVTGEPIDDLENPKNGMVVDFGDLKQIVNQQIVDKFDHALVLNKKDAKNTEFINNPLFYKLIKVNYQPTCENMVADFATLIAEKLPPDVILYAVKLQETSTSYAEWYAYDNQK